jgi:ATPases involved in chromosome partitioning
MQVISFMAIKGGVGKTTMAFQLAKFFTNPRSKSIDDRFRRAKRV